MKVLRLTAIIILAWVGVASAQSITVEGVQYACESVTVSINGTGSLTQATFQPGGSVPPVRRALITVTDSHVMWRADGTTATATGGLLATLEDDVFVIVLNNEDAIRNFSAYGLGAAAATLKICYER
ncbi:hypothetical protein LCGC14_0337920 [marine sediment metagenome]|uniref:Uncharacterized protein n=1 Tax=marine sediment metagenome TaxID=412755 RepID=A0A0F9WLX7_9ZZZZ